MESDEEKQPPSPDYAIENPGRPRAPSLFRVFISRIRRACARSRTLTILNISTLSAVSQMGICRVLRFESVGRRTNCLRIIFFKMYCFVILLSGPIAADVVSPDIPRVIFDRVPDSNNYTI